MDIRLLASLWGLFAGVFLLLAGVGSLGTLVPLRLGLIDASNLVVGIIGACYFLGFSFGTFFAHRLIANVGHIRAFAAFASTLSAATLLHPFLVASVPWGVLRFAEGLCVAGLLMCVESWLNDRASTANRGRVLSAYMVAVYLGQAFGQMLLPLPDATGFGLFVISSLLMSLAVVPVTISRGPAPALPQPTRIEVRRLLSASPLGVAGAMISGVILGAFYGLAPLFTQQLGFDTTGTSHFMALAILGGTLLQWPVGRLSDWTDRRLVLLGVATALGGIALVLSLIGPFGIAGLPVLAPLLGGTMFTLYPLSVAHTIDRTAAEDLVPTSGALVTAYGIGAAVGPLVAGGAMATFGPNGLFYFIAGVGFATGAFGVWRTRVSAPVPMAEQATFQALPRTTPMASALDPRAEAEPPPDGMPLEPGALP